jgi:site-specific recombinase XerC
MAATIPSAAAVPVTPVFTNTDRLALAGFRAVYSGLTRQACEPDLRQYTSWSQQRHSAAVRPSRRHRVLRPRPRSPRPRIVRRLGRRAGIAKHVGPHTLRHAFITAALDAGVPLRDVQEAASRADLRTTMRYDRARTSLDRHATYIVAAYVAGAAR